MGADGKRSAVTQGSGKAAKQPRVDSMLEASSSVLPPPPGGGTPCMCSADLESAARMLWTAINIRQTSQAGL